MPKPSLDEIFGSQASASGTGGKPSLDEIFASNEQPIVAQRNVPMYDRFGMSLTPEQKIANPILAGIQQTAQDVATLGYKGADGLLLGNLSGQLRKRGIEPPNFENTAPENKSGLNLGGDVLNLGGLIRNPLISSSANAAVAGKAVKSAITGGAAGFLTNPTEEDNTINRLKQGAFGAAGAAAIPVAMKIPNIVSKAIAPATEEQLNAKIAEEINKGLRQGIRPSSTGERTRSAFTAKKFTDDSASAVKDIVQNKGTLEFTDESGDVIKGQLPNNLKETADAMNQRMKSLADSWTSLAKQSGESGNTIETRPMINSLNDILNDRVFATEHPTDYAKIKSIRDGLKLRGKMTPSDALDKVQEWNADLRGNYKTGFKYGSTRAVNVVKEMNDTLRDSLSNVIESSTGREFQALRNQWGAYKSLIKDVQHRTNIVGRQNPKSIWSFLDAAGNAEIAGGAVHTATGNPAGVGMMVKGAAMKFGKGLIQRANDPNEIVRNMFTSVDKLMEKSSALNQARLNPAAEDLTNMKSFGSTSPLGINEENPVINKDHLLKSGKQEILNTPTGDFNPIKPQGKPTGKVAKAVVGGALAGSLAMGGSAQAATLGQKNNNPINLKAFDKWEGMTGKDNFGHAQFKDLDSGIRAAIKNLEVHKAKNPTQSLESYMNNFAEKNGTKEAQYIAKQLGISPKTSIAKIDMKKLLIHLAKFESKIDLTDADIQRVVKKFNLK